MILINLGLSVLKTASKKVFVFYAILPKSKFDMRSELDFLLVEISNTFVLELLDLHFFFKLSSLFDQA